MIDAKLANLMSSSATGFAVVIDGILNIDTVSESPNIAAFIALPRSGHGLVAMIAGCQDTDCDCRVKLMGQLMPTAKVVSVAIQVTP